jgi:hypothetical protein
MVSIRVNSDAPQFPKFSIFVSAVFQGFFLANRHCIAVFSNAIGYPPKVISQPSWATIPQTHPLTYHGLSL